MKHRIRKKLQRYCCPRCRSRDVTRVIPFNCRRLLVVECGSCRYTFNRYGIETESKWERIEITPTEMAAIRKWAFGESTKQPVHINVRFNV